MAEQYHVSSGFQKDWASCNKNCTLGERKTVILKESEQEGRGGRTYEDRGAVLHAPGKLQGLGLIWVVFDIEKIISVTCVDLAAREGVGRRRFRLGSAEPSTVAQRPALIVQLCWTLCSSQGWRLILACLSSDARISSLGRKKRKRRSKY